VPLYSFRCPNDHNFERVLKVKDYDTLQYCDCGQKAKRQIVPTMIAPEFQDYQSPIDGAAISTKKRRIEEMAKHDCVDYEPSLKLEADKRVKEDEIRMDKSVDKTVDKLWYSMTSQQRENLARELTSGADINYLRR